MNTLLFFVLTLPSLVKSQYYTPKCLTNYTTFLNYKYDNVNNTLDIIDNMNANICGKVCYNYTNCTGFSFIHSTWIGDSKCILTTLPYKYIDLEYDFTNGFYLKSNSSCIFYDYKNLIIIITGLVVCTLGLCCCYNFGKKRSNKSQYQRIK